MRNGYTRGHSARTPRQSSNFLNKNILIVIAIIIALMVIIKVFSGEKNNSTPTGNFMAIALADSKSSAYITNEKGNREQISTSGALYANGSSLTVESGNVTGNISASTFDISSSSEIFYKNQTSSSDSSLQEDIVKMNRGIFWVNSESNNLVVELSNFSAKVPSGTKAIFEQANSIFSTVYVMQGEVTIMTSAGQYALTAGKKLSLSSGEAANQNLKLSDKVNDFDTSVSRMEIFTRNNGEEILKNSSQTSTEQENQDISTQSGATASGATLNGTHTKYIAFTQPTDGATIKTATTTIMGTMLSTDIARITFNDSDAVISPVNESFTMENFPLVNGINNIVYKVYSLNGIELERGVLVVHGATTAQKVNTIVPENFPNLKDFVITSPKSNPYATTESYVRVQGSVPANTVKYITVNGYRLQKFVANSTTWYYHANAAIGTIKDGANLYYIKFYDNNDREIHTQLFTIIKDSPNASKNSETTELAPLFPAN